MDYEKEYKKLKKTQEELEIALQNSPLQYWTYYPKEHYCVEGIGTNSNFNIPKKMNNYPWSFVEMGVVHPDDIEKFYENHRKIDNGENEVVFEIRTIHYTSIYEEGKIIKAIAVAEQIDELEYVKTRFNIAMKQCKIESYIYNGCSHFLNGILGKIPYPTERKDIIFN